MTAHELKDVLSSSGYRVDGGTLFDVADFVEVLASQPKSKGYLFAALTLKDGRVAAVWETHAAIAASMQVLFGDEEHDPALNNHEKTLVTYGVK